MTRETSIEAYAYVQKCGYIGEKQREIYNALYGNGPMTSAETYAVILKFKKGRTAITSTRSRFTELRDMGAIQELGYRKCTITGRKAIVWAVTSSIPHKRVKVKKERCSHCNGTGYKITSNEAI